jgi:hypothetical protein
MMSQIRLLLLLVHAFMALNALKQEGKTNNDLMTQKIFISCNIKGFSAV